MIELSAYLLKHFRKQDKALASLLLKHTALGATLNAGSGLSIGNLKNKMNEMGIINNTVSMQKLEGLLNNLIEMIA